MATSMRLLFRRLTIQNRVVSSNCRYVLGYKLNKKTEVTSLPSQRAFRFIYTSKRYLNEEHFEEDEVNKDEVSKDIKVDIETAINYIGSEEYIEKYGDKPVFANYRRNFKGGVPPKKTRKTCIRGKGENLRVAGNPCPLCRDDQLLLHYKNIKLLEQFVCPHSREIYSWYRTSVCQMRHKQLVKAVEESRSLGMMPSPHPVFVKYDYNDYYSGYHGHQNETPTSS